ncbi:DUF6479 family protein [Kitasatospora terrestris]|uniref:Secreted protein n=1 Tax=Kitasatospora terrestris TaxID=258051 RepID=A0ABP9EN28_9ACTN
MVDRTVQLSASLSGTGLLVPAVVILAVLIAAFVWGSRRRARAKGPAYRPGERRGPRSGSWSTPDESDADRPGGSEYGDRPPSR